MKKYLVGGAVRDSLLKLPITEKDWVITGSSPQELLKRGYEQVGKEFPVFLHPIDHEEYALARTERKSGKGYKGFTFVTDPSITIEEDLYRRDLTINAMAYDMDGNLLDPYNGQRDIQLRLLRHVSHAFCEDPLRVLRVARFAAKLKNIGFTIAPETLKIMINMTKELQSLSVERVWMETKKALSTNNPQIYFQILQKCGALKILFPEINLLFAKSDDFSKQYSYCIKNLGDYTMKKLFNISCLSKDIAIRFSILCSNLKKSNKPLKNFSKTHSINHSQLSAIDNLCHRLKIPNHIYKLSKTVYKFNDHLCDFLVLSPKKIIDLFTAFNCWKNPKQIETIILFNKAHLLTNNHNTKILNIQENKLRTTFSITNQIKIYDILKDGFTGSNISEELYFRRLRILTAHNNSII